LSKLKASQISGPGQRVDEDAASEPTGFALGLRGIRSPDTSALGRSHLPSEVRTATFEDLGLTRQRVSEWRTACDLEALADVKACATVAAGDQPRFLSRRSERLYTSDPAKAMRSEPEAISAQAQREITADSHRREREVLLSSWAQTSDRVRGALDHFEQVVDVERVRLRSPLRALRRQVDQLDQRIASGP
jgi:hypothetical protein